MLKPIDALATAQHLATKVRSTTVVTDPAPYIFMENVFPKETYEGILDAYRASSGAFKEQIHKGDPKIFFGSYRDRLEFRVEEGMELAPDVNAFWLTLKSAFESEAFFSAIVSRFESGFRARFGERLQQPGFRSSLRPTMLVTRHRTNYFLGPHTDRFEKIVTCLFNCPEQAGLDHLGTAMYRPKEPGFTCKGTVHHNPELFEKIATVPFLRNSALIFFRDDRLFHGVERLTVDSLVGTDRPNVQFNLWE